DGAAAWRSYRRNIFRSRSHRDRKVSTITTMLLADRYAELRETTRIRERALFPPQRIPSELELQARWFAGDFGKHFVTTTADKIDRQFFTSTKSNRNVTQVCIDLTILPDAFSANIPLARPGRCQSPLKDLTEERVVSVLDAAAQFRWQQKAARIYRKIEDHGR